MAILNYTTYSDAKEIALGLVDGPVDITLSGSSQQSAVFSSTVRRIEIVADAAIRYAIGQNPDVDANTGHYLPANVVIYKEAKANERIAVKEA
jgi:hypothetical protein